MTITQRFRIDPTEFADSRVLVTGGTKGAGEAIKRRFKSAGARTATSARTQPQFGDAIDLFVQADLTTSRGRRITGGIDPPETATFSIWSIRHSEGATAPARATWVSNPPPRAISRAIELSQPR